MRFFLATIALAALGGAAAQPSVAGGDSFYANSACVAAGQATCGGADSTLCYTPCSTINFSTRRGGSNYNICSNGAIRNQQYPYSPSYADAPVDCQTWYAIQNDPTLTWDYCDIDETQFDYTQSYCDPVLGTQPIPDASASTDAPATDAPTTDAPATDAPTTAAPLA